MRQFLSIPMNYPSPMQPTQAAPEPPPHDDLMMGATPPPALPHPPAEDPGRPATLAGAVPLPGLEPWNGFGRQA